jgi:hypothetical protein
MSAHPKRPSASQVPSVELRVLDPGGQHLTFIWQILNGHGHLLATGQVAGAPNTPALAGWRYHAFTDAARAAITALQDLEATQRRSAADDDRTQRARTCDFCAAAPAAYRYPTRRAGIVRIGGAVVVLPGGDWLACPACHLLVEAQLWDILSAQARLSAEHGVVLWAYFRESRGGPAVPLDASQGGDVG